MHKVRRRRQLAVVRELWQTRDRIAQRRDVSPGKVLGDAAIVEAALALPANVHALAALNGFGHRMGKRQLEQWQAAVDRAKALERGAVAAAGAAGDRAAAAAGLGRQGPRGCGAAVAARAGVSALAEQLNMPQENLITPDTVRRVCWEPPKAVDAESVAAALAGHGARPWQVEQVAPVLVEALSAKEA